MLEPQDRSLLLEALKPPPEYRVDYAIGTTYTLDLSAMLIAPLAFALLDRSDREGRLVPDAVALVQSLRRCASSLTVFCSVGSIKPPRGASLLQNYLEGSVCEVAAPRGGVFHPKVWVLRLVKDGAAVRYRFLCASRNLTFDSSWDTLLVLEGDLIERKNAYARNHPLADFIKGLPELAVREVAPSLRERVAQFESELRRVDFELPEGFEELQFRPLGLPGYREWPFEGRIDDLLVVAPFVCPRGISHLASSAKRMHLVSRLDQVQALLPEQLGRCATVRTFNDELHEDAATEATEDQEQALEAESDADRLTGLHAKLYIADAGWQSRVWTGSANATEAAYENNVEFLVELSGKKSAVGIDAFMGAVGNPPGFAAFLAPYDARTQSNEKTDLEAMADLELERACRVIATAPWRLVAKPDESGAAWTLSLILPPDQPITLPDTALVQCWPITCRFESNAHDVCESSSSERARFDSLPLEALTSFVAFHVEIQYRCRWRDKSFVLNVPIDGLPADRQRRLLAKLLGNAEAVKRYILLLLEDPRQRIGTPGGFTLRAGSLGEPAPSYTPEEAVLEPLVRALHRDVKRLDEVASLVADLAGIDAAEKQLPADWNAIWPAIWEARKALSNEESSA